jgi:hypothetical protein
MKMETVEHFAKVALVAHLLGEEQPLDEEAIGKLLQARKKYPGARSAAPMPIAGGNGAPGGNHHASGAEVSNRELVSGTPAGTRSQPRR